MDEDTDADEREKRRGSRTTDELGAARRVQQWAPVVIDNEGATTRDRPIL